MSRVPGDPANPIRRFSRHEVAIGDDRRSLIIGALVYWSDADLRVDWQVDSDGSASLKADARCEVEGFRQAESPLGRFATEFRLSGFDEVGALAFDNVILVFPALVRGDDPFGGNGLDREMRAEVERLIRGLHKE